MGLEEELLELAARHEEELDGLFWASEHDRWVELIFCVLNAFGDDPSRCRQLVAVLQGAELLEPAVLARSGEPGEESGTVLRYLLVQHGLGPDDASRAGDLLARIGRAIEKHHQGKIQRYLRQQGERIRDDLLGLFGDAAQPDPELRQGVTHWLQNAAGIPLSLGEYDRTLQQFCQDRGVGQRQLADAADEVDFNLALVDDVIKADLDQPDVAGDRHG